MPSMLVTLSTASFCRRLMSACVSTAYLLCTGGRGTVGQQAQLAAVAGGRLLGATFHRTRLALRLSLINNSEPKRLRRIKYAVFCLNKKFYKQVQLTLTILIILRVLYN